MTSSWVGNIAAILAWLDKNCGFFANGEILGQFGFFASVSILPSINTFSTVQGSTRYAYLDVLTHKTA